MKKGYLVLLTVLAFTCSARASVWMGYFTVYDDTFWPEGRSANYGVVKYFLDESAGESFNITFEVDIYPEGRTISEVVLWSNLGRRDYAKMYERFEDGGDPASSYYLGYPMTYSGPGASAGHVRYRVTLPVNQCGVFRATAYFRLAGDSTRYWMNDFEYGGTAHRDVCIVVSPKKVLDLRIYEANIQTVEAGPGGTESDRSTFEDFTSADSDSFDPFNLHYIATNLGFNTLWLMPIHPITRERWTNTCAEAPDACGYVTDNYIPGSPYSTTNYWDVNPYFSAAGSATAAFEAFSNLCVEAEELGLNVFIDVAMNHAGRDCIFGQGAYEAGLISASDIGREVRNAIPTWCTRGSDWSGGEYYFREHAMYDADAATWAPADQPYRHRWYDAGVDWFFGNYSALGCYYSYCDGIGTYDDERDLFWTWTSPSADYEATVASNVWAFFAYYVPYWVRRTGGRLDGIRADFAQGLPAQAWEFIINKARQTKWDFVFLGEVLDDSPVRYRSNRHLDLITTVYHGSFRTNNLGMSHYRDILEDEADLLSYTAAVLWYGTSHDEDPGEVDPWMLWARYAIAATLYGVPMVYQGQPLGVPEKINFESAWSNMYAFWTDSSHNNANRNECYRRVNRARELHPALRSTKRYFLNTVSGGFNEGIYSCARWSSESAQEYCPDITNLEFLHHDVDLVFVNLGGETGISETYTIPTDVGLKTQICFFSWAWRSNTIYKGTPYFQGYNLLATNSEETLFGAPKSAWQIYNNGVTISMNYANEAQYWHLTPVLALVPKILTNIWTFGTSPRFGDFLALYPKARELQNLYMLYSGEVAAVLLNPENASLLSTARYLVRKAMDMAEDYFVRNIDRPLPEQDIRKGINLLLAIRNRTNNQDLRHLLSQLISCGQSFYGKTFRQALMLLVSGN